MGPFDKINQLNSFSGFQCIKHTQVDPATFKHFPKSKFHEFFSLQVSADFAPVDGLTFLLTIFFENLWRLVALESRHVPTLRLDDVSASLARLFATLGPAGLSTTGSSLLRSVERRTPLSWNL